MDLYPKPPETVKSYSDSAKWPNNVGQVAITDRVTALESDVSNIETDITTIEAKDTAQDNTIRNIQEGVDL